MKILDQGVLVLALVLAAAAPAAGPPPLRALVLGRAPLRATQARMAPDGTRRALVTHWVEEALPGHRHETVVFDFASGDRHPAPPGALGWCGGGILVARDRNEVCVDARTGLPFDGDPAPVRLLDRLRERDPYRAQGGSARGVRERARDAAGAVTRLLSDGRTLLIDHGDANVSLHDLATGARRRLPQGGWEWDVLPRDPGGGLMAIGTAEGVNEPRAHGCGDVSTTTRLVADDGSGVLLEIDEPPRLRAYLEILDVATDGAVLVRAEKRRWALPREGWAAMTIESDEVLLLRVRRMARDASVSRP